MESLASSMKFDWAMENHPRGKFPTINVGVMPGQGSKCPHNIDLGRYSQMMEALLVDEDVQLIAGFHNCGFFNCPLHLHPPF
jgi:hypothetical protein